MKQMKEIIKPDVLFVKLSGAGELDGYEGNVYKEELVFKLCDKIDTKDKILEIAVRQISWMVKAMESRTCPENCIDEHVPCQEEDGETDSYQCEWCACKREALSQIEAMKGEE